jgi:hypothetical protein
VHGSGTVGKIPLWTDTRPNGDSTLGDSIITQLNGNIGIGLATPMSKLSVQGMIETTLGGYKFPDGTVQTTAAVSGLQSVIHDSTLTGDGTSGSPLRVTVPLVLSGTAPTILIITNNGSGGGYGLRAQGAGESGFGGYGVIGDGGDSESGTGGTGVAGLGGASPSGTGGIGVSSAGGNSQTGKGGIGLNALGGFSESGEGGAGMTVRGGQSNSGAAGIGVIVLGGQSFTDNVNGGAGVKVTGGFSKRGTGGEGVSARGGLVAGGTGGVGVFGGGGDDSFGPAGVGGTGVVGSGGNSQHGSGGNGVEAIGGKSNDGGFGGHGVVATGGDFNGRGVVAKGGVGSVGYGVEATGGASTGSGSTAGAGVYAKGGPSSGSNSESGFGLFAIAGDATDGAMRGKAAAFEGDVTISDNLTVSGNLDVQGSKHFKIDHPLDPENKYLLHASVESSEVLNVYSGNVVTDAKGNAIVTLPDWFEAINHDLRYQLTVIGQFAQAIVASEAQHNRFTIKTSRPNVKVSWQVTGVRSDRVMQKHPFRAVEDKPERERGTYLNPELFGKPDERGVEWARNPEMMRQLKQRQIELEQTAKPRKPGAR